MRTMNILWCIFNVAVVIGAFYTGNHFLLGMAIGCPLGNLWSFFMDERACKKISEKLNEEDQKILNELMDKVKK